MSELRQNMATKEWVIIATDRARRPDDYTHGEEAMRLAELPKYDASCPFCPGNEELDLEVERRPETGLWQTRVVDNKYPALSRNGNLLRNFNGVHRRLTGVGHHEVVVEHPHHNTTLALMSVEEVRVVLETFYYRGWSLNGDRNVKQLVFFKNHGKRAGASLKHPHSQLIGLPVVPTDIRHRIEESRRYYDDHGDCVFCAMLQHELDDGERIVCMSEHFVAFVLYAASTPFHMWILPRQHSVSFLYAQPDQLTDLAWLLRDILRRMYIGLKDPAYNFIIRTAPVTEISSEYFHWYITVVPRLSRLAGFEMGSGMYINPALPEACADFLRNVDTT